MNIAETSRLVLRKFNSGDAQFIFELVNTPSWLKYIGDRNIKNPAAAANYLKNGPIKSYRQHGYGLYLVKLKNNTPIGMCGLIKRENLDDVDIGFAFMPQYEGKGYAHESAVAVMALAGKLGLKRIVAITLPENESSIRLLKKINMKFDTMIHFPGEKKPLMHFSINF